jgi:S-adenosylmethionine hydrolase
MGVASLPNRIEGRVAQIGKTGSLVTDISVDQIADIPHDDSVSVRFGGHETIGIYPASHGQPDATMVASVGRSGFLEIEIVGINLSEMLGIKTDVPVEVTW